MPAVSSHASHVRFMERGRTELVRSLSVSQADLLEQDGLLGGDGDE